MDTTNKLEASGLLYEGINWWEWVDTLRPILAQHFSGVSLRRSDHSASEYFCRIPLNICWSDVCDSIWWRVSPHVRSRVPEKYRMLPGELLKALRVTAQPFRFVDLPAEIRLRIYHLE